MLLPGPQYPPVVVALLPTNGKESAVQIHNYYMKLLKMADQLDLKIISSASDGAAAELSAQNMMDNEASVDAPIVHDNLNMATTSRFLFSRQVHMVRHRILLMGGKRLEIRVSMAPKLRV
jgi:hypothetical protein